MLNGRSFRQSICVDGGCRRDRAGAPRACDGSPRAPLLLARPRSRHERQPARRRAGADGALARVGGDRRRPRRRARRLQGHRRCRLARAAARLAQGGRQQGLLPAPEPAEDQGQEGRGRPAPGHQRGPGGPVRLPLGPAAVFDAGNNDRIAIMPGLYTEPRVAGEARERPDLQPEPAAGGRQRRPDAELPLPGHLPERPEPDLRAGPRARGGTAGAAARGSAGDPGLRAGPLRALQPPDRGHRRQARGRDHGRRHGLPEYATRRRSPAATPRTSSCESTAPTASSGATS